MRETRDPVNGSKKGAFDLSYDHIITIPINPHTNPMIENHQKTKKLIAPKTTLTVPKANAATSNLSFIVLYLLHIVYSYIQ